VKRAVAISRTAAVSAFGAATHGLADALAHGTALAGLPDDVPLAQPRALKMMSRAAYLAARCLASLRSGRPLEAAGYYLGVGASGGSLDDFMALLAESLVDGKLSLAQFGTRGLAACHPLLAFQLMNNFTLCHGAILEHVSGPNSALFSRGAGTVAAIAEAVHAVETGECEIAITGGADAPTHPATLAELARDGFVDRGLCAADAVGLLELEPAVGNAIVIEGCATASGRGRTVAAAITDAVSRVTRDFDVIVIAPWGPPAEDALRSFAGATPIISTRLLGDSLAATPALALIAAHDLLVHTPGRALVLSLGVDGDPAAISVARGPA